MIIVATDGDPIDHAWLDAGLINPSYRGTRCRLVVGRSGGIVCDLVETHRSYDEEGLIRLAEHAVVMTDPSDPDALAVVDGRGRPARLVEPDGVVGVDRRIIRRHASEIDASRPHWSGRSNTALICVVVLAPLLGAVATVRSLEWFDQMPMLPFTIAAGHLALAWIALSMIRSRARRHDQRVAAWSRLAREMERRRTIPSVIPGDAT